MRQHIADFQTVNTAIVVVGPESAAKFAAYWQKEDLPFIGLPDPGRVVLNLFGQETSLMRLGRMPAQVWVDIEGYVRLQHCGNSMWDIPEVEEVLNQIAQWDLMRFR